MEVHQAVFLVFVSKPGLTHFQCIPLLCHVFMYVLIFVPPHFISVPPHSITVPPHFIAVPPHFMIVPPHPNNSVPPHFVSVPPHF